MRVIVMEIIIEVAWEETTATGETTKTVEVEEEEEEAEIHNHSLPPSNLHHHHHLLNLNNTKKILSPLLIPTINTTNPIMVGEDIITLHTIHVVVIEVEEGVVIVVDEVVASLPPELPVVVDRIPTFDLVVHWIKLLLPQNQPRDPPQQQQRLLRCFLKC